MAAGDLVQKGTAVSVGFMGKTYASLIMQAVSFGPDSELKEIKGENNATTTEIYSNPGAKLTLEGVVLSSALTALKAIKKGDAVTVDSVAYRVDDIEIKGSPEEAHCTISLIKRDSMTHA